MDAGASRILYPKPTPGVTVTPLKTKADWKAAEREFAHRAQEEDFPRIIPPTSSGTRWKSGLPTHQIVSSNQNSFIGQFGDSL